MHVLRSKLADLGKDWRQEFVVDQESSSCFGADQWVSTGEGRDFGPPLPPAPGKISYV